MKNGSYYSNFYFISEANHLCMEHPILKDHNTGKNTRQIVSSLLKIELQKNMLSLEFRTQFSYKIVNEGSQ